MKELLLRAKNGDKDAKGQLIEENSGLVWSIARRYIGRGVDTEDLYQLGCLGFLKAVEGYDPDFGTQFSTYAVPKIAGEIRRFLRDDGSVKVSRCIKERASAIKVTRQRLASQLDGEPTLSQIAHELGITVEEVAEAEMATAATESIHKENGEGGFTLEDVLTAGSGEEELIERIALKEAVFRLAERERTVIALRYYRGATQDQCAKILGVSQVQISRIEKKALQTLRTYFDK